MKIFLLNIFLAMPVFLQSGVAIAAGGEKKAGLPQMDPTWFASQVFWLLIVFSFLYIVFGRSVLPNLSTTLKTRRELVEGDLETAKSMKEKAENVHQAYEEILDEARNEASNVFSATEAKIKENFDKQLEVLRADYIKQTQATEKKLEKATQEAMAEIDGVVAELAAEATKKIIGLSADKKTVTAIISNMNKDKKAA